MKSTHLSLPPTLLPKLALALLSSLLMTGFTSTRAAEKSTAPQAKVIESSPIAIRDSLLAKAKATKLDAADSFQLALAFFRNGQLIEATTVARLTLGATTNLREKAALYALVSEAEGARGKYREAAQAALEGQRCNPDSPELAVLRFAYFSKLGDMAQAEAASDCLLHTDVNRGKPVFGVAQAIIVISFGKQVIEVLADAYQVWYLDEINRGRNPHLWLDNPTVKTSCKVIEKLWGLGRLVPPPLTTSPTSIQK